MHAQTKTALFSAIRAEVQGDPAQRGYAGKTATQIAALMAAPVPAPTPDPVPRAFKWGDARGIAQSHGCWPLIVLRARATPTIPPATVTDGAVLAAINAVSTEREQVIDATDAAVWQAFTTGIAAFRAVGDLTEAAVTAILALGTEQPPTPPAGPSRWLVVIDGIGGVGNLPGPPNGPDAALIGEAMANGK
jgi:hypothetical protein